MGGLFLHPVLLLFGCRRGPARPDLGGPLRRDALRVSHLRHFGFHPRAGAGRLVGGHRANGLLHLLHQIARICLRGLSRHARRPLCHMAVLQAGPPSGHWMRMDSLVDRSGLPALGSLRPGRHGLHGGLVLADARRVADVQDCRQRHGPALRCRRPLGGMAFLRTNQPFDRIHGRASQFRRCGRSVPCLPHTLLYNVRPSAGRCLPARRCPETLRGMAFAGPPYSGIGRHGMGPPLRLVRGRELPQGTAHGTRHRGRRLGKHPHHLPRRHGRTHTAHGDEQEPGALQAGTRRRRNVPIPRRRRAPQRPPSSCGWHKWAARRSITTTDW